MMASPETTLREQLAAIVAAATGMTTLAFRPEITLPADFAVAGVDPLVGYAYIHVPSVNRKSYDLRVDVEIHLLMPGVVNGTGYESTAEAAAELGSVVTAQQNDLTGFSDPANFRAERGNVEVGGSVLAEVTIFFQVYSSVAP